MAKKNKGTKSARAKTTSKSRAKVGRNRASKAKLAKARNDCCPLVAFKCAELPGKREKVVFRDPYSGKTSTSYRPGPKVTKCAVKVGANNSGFKYTVEEKDKRLAEVRAALEAKRCTYVEADFPEKAPKLTKAQKSAMISHKPYAAGPSSAY